jgi:shikimate dehydrogenase
MRLYGLIGFPLTHSFSKTFFEQKFSNEGLLDCAFENFPLKNIEELRQLIANHPQLKGFAVTIPYKKKVIRFLDEGTDAVKQMVACNCVKLKAGKLKGYNTDVTGFEKSFTKLLKPHHLKALILGTGGAADAVAYVLRKLGIDYLFVSRSQEIKPLTISYKALAEDLLADHTIIINCTPLGTAPDSETFPKIPYQYLTSRHYLFDLVYNPADTTFMQKGREQGALVCNGYEMLTIQAEENWRIWNS